MFFTNFLGELPAMCAALLAVNLPFAGRILELLLFWITLLRTDAEASVLRMHTDMRGGLGLLISTGPEPSVMTTEDFKLRDEDISIVSDDKDV